MPLALGILLVAFGALLAAVLPVGLALTSFLAANGLLALVSHRLHLDTSTSSVMLLVGLAVGVDYCMFYLRRVREERAHGRDPDDGAADRGGDLRPLGPGLRADGRRGDVGHVPLRDAALRRVRDRRDPRRARGGGGSVTVLPAVLSLLGDRVDFGRVPGLARMRRPGDGSKAWGAILGPVLKRPGRLGLRCGRRSCCSLAAPAIAGIHTENLSLDKLLPADASIMQSYHRITAAFPGGPDARRTSWSRRRTCESSELTAAVAEFRARALATGLVHEPIVVEVAPEANVVEITVPLAGAGSDATSVRALHVLRDDVVPGDLRASCRAPRRTSGATSPSRRTSTPSCSTRSCR